MSLSTHAFHQSFDIKATMKLSFFLKTPGENRGNSRRHGCEREANIGSDLRGMGQRKVTGEPGGKKGDLTRHKKKKEAHAFAFSGRAPLKSTKKPHPMDGVRFIREPLS